VDAPRSRFLFTTRDAGIAKAVTDRKYLANLLSDGEARDLLARSVALNAGFKSIRQFNHAIRTASGQSPTELRHSRENSEAAARQSGLVIRLAYRPPLNWSALISFLGSRATPGVECVGEGSYRRTIESGGGVGTINLAFCLVKLEPCP
jgi:AraC family transcriptional regulator, regulatory protein of adaptative response / DNA-3-methyladenine glycosylase II